MSLFISILFMFPLYGICKDVPYFHALNGDEYDVQFQADFQTEFRTQADIASLTNEQKVRFINEFVHPTVKYINGPMTHRQLGGIQRNIKIHMLWNQSFEKQNRVYVPYIYQGTWILHKDFFFQNIKTVPVPMTAGVLSTPRWDRCTESHGQYPDMSLFWYYWDPERSGCDHKLGVQYQIIPIQLKKMTVNQKLSYPEYSRLIRSRANGEKEFRITLAFGYAEDNSRPNPDMDQDIGAREYRKVINYMRQQRFQGFQEQPILPREYEPENSSQTAMGYRYWVIRDGIQYVIQVVISSEIDQMLIFAKSFARDHDSFFAWFGHSRVGWGFDADRMRDYLTHQSNLYKVTSLYQIVYWAGCNSYSYYTLPFFQMKAGPQDPLGTRNLDIISNGLPSYFSINALKAKIMLKHILNWKMKSSYQQIIQELEREASRYGFRHVLINVMGDEDNSKLD
jgi:hypothetical protein